MSTIIRTPLGSFEIDGGRIRSNNPILQAIIDARREEDEERRRQARDTAERNRIERESREAQIRAQAEEESRRSVERAVQESDRRLERVRRDNAKKMKDIEDGFNDRVSGMQEESKRQLSDLRKKQNEAISHLERKVYDDLEKTNEAIRTTTGRVDELDSGLKTLTDHVGRLEDEVNQRFTEQEEEIRNVQSEVSQISSRLDSIDSRGTERAAMATAWMREVEKANDLDRFVPEEAEKVRRRIHQIAQSGASGAELSAMANEAILAAQELEIDCNKQRLKYEQKEEITRTMLESVLQTVNSLREIRLEGTEGDVVDIENNYWSRGRYNEIKTQIEGLREEIENRSQTDMTIERLDEIQKTLIQKQEEVQKITAESVAKVQLSQARMNTISDIIDVMEEQHWEVIEENGREAIDYAGGEEESDWREGAFARLRNDMGEEVTVIVDPDEDETHNTLNIHYGGNHVATDQENEQKVAAIAEEIRKSGYEVGVPRCAGHQAMPEMESTESMTQQGASTRIRERMDK